MFTNRHAPQAQHIVLRSGALLPAQVEAGKKAFLFLFALLLSCSLWAQQRVSGTVIDQETDAPLAGAAVIVQGTSTGAYTDDEGKFSLTVPDGNAVLMIRFLGYKTLEVPVAGRTELTINLEPDVSTLGEVVVIGYGTQEKKDLTGAIVSVSSKDFVVGNINTPEQLINGKIPGVQITPNSGAPGAGSRIRIRGGASLNASNDPLIVIDGVPVDNSTIFGAANPLSLINPNDIETFTVLKDASATAIYGSRASNGVILITTKKGKAGRPLQINFNSVLSVAQNTRRVDVLNADQFRAAVDSVGGADRVALLGDANTDWQSEIYRPAFSQDNTLSINGAIGKLPFRASAGFLNQNGVLLTSNMKRATGSIGLSPSFLDDHLRVNVNVKASQINQNFADQGAIGSAVAFDPTQPVYSDTTAFGGFYEWLDPSTGNPNPLAPRNPLGLLMQRADQSNVFRSVGNVQVDYRFHFLPELRANVNLGYDISESNGTTIIPDSAASNFFRSGQDKTYSQSRRNYTSEFYLNYVKELSSISSNIDLVAGYGYYDFWRENDELDLNLVSPPDTFRNLTRDLSRTQNTLVSFYGRMIYTFKDRYMLTATLRQDGSSRFSPETRWGLFPSMALAWQLDEESFIQNLGVFSNLKVRLGYGVTGQQDVLSDYPYLARYTPSEDNAQYQFGEIFYTTLRPEGYDANIKWEETVTYNAGIDFGFADDRITASVDYYFKETQDLLSVIPLPAGSNFTNQLLTNVGNIENEGVEVNTNFAFVRTQDVDVNLGVNFTYNVNTITNLTKAPDSSFQGLLVGGIGGGVGNTVQIHSVGFPTFSYYLYEQVYDDNGKPIEGEYADLNGDGEVTPDDRYRTQSPNPTYFIGINGQARYKNFNLSFVMRSNLGAYVYNNVASQNGVYRTINSSFPYLTNLTSDVLETDFDNNQYFSDYYLERANFLRMDNLALSYTFQSLFGSKLNAQVSAIAQNLFVLTNYTGLDPEVANGIDNNLYPVPRTISLGINLTY
jgi:TonB-linked SusC/RagA family outer membrane protein